MEKSKMNERQKVILNLIDFAFAYGAPDHAYQIREALELIEELQSKGD